MSERPGTLEQIGRHLALALAPLRRAMADQDSFLQLVYRLGFEAEALPPAYAELGEAAERAVEALEALAEEPSPADLAALLGKVKEVYQALKAISVAPPGVDAGAFLAEIGERLFELLFTDYLRAELPMAFNLLQALDVIEIENRPADATHHAFIRTCFKWGEIPKIVGDPLSLVRRVYGWGEPELEFSLILDHLSGIFLALGLPVVLPETEEELIGRYSGILDQPLVSSQEMLKVPFYYTRLAGQVAEAALVVMELPAAGGKLPGIVIQPEIPPQLSLSLPLSPWADLRIRAGSDLASRFGILIRPGEVGVKYPFQAGTELPQAGFALTFDYHPESTTLLLGSPGATRLELAGAEAGLKVDYLAGDLELTLGAELRGLALVVAAGEGDSFLRDLLGEGEKRVDVPLGLEWSSQRGFHFKGGGGLEVEIPSHLELGPIVVEAIEVRLSQPPEPGPRLRAGVGANMKGRLGPLTATVRGLGVELDLLFADGNAGPFDIEVGFRWPTGVGLAIDGGGFKGGGFLLLDPEKGEYAGLLELEFEDKFALKAVGLLNTRLPGGQAGFSLILVITAELPPVQLGFGFTLLGVGGLIGIHRSAMVDRLRSGVRDGTLSSILFPQDVVANANRILSDLRQVFPPTPGRFVFGPMARIGWGTPTLVSIDLGLIVELPSPVRILILGVLRMILPDENADILRLQVNFLGVIDFEAGMLSFDASIYESRLLAFPLSGDMAVRLKWLGEANFLLTVGGFHPLYQPPPLGLPPLRRITLQLLGGTNPRLTLEAYFALTSNTVQFGARLELLAGGSFNVYGFLSLDVLLQFNPFYFIAAIGAMLALRAGSSTIAAISVAFTLEGPTPWHAYGKASLKICWFLTISVRFDTTWGEQRETRLDDVAVLPLLKSALADEGNWQAALPAGKNLLVTLKQLDAGPGLVVSPAGVLTISQKVVPLNVELQLFGAQKPADAKRFAIEQVSAGPPGNSEPLGISPIKEDFAPAQFFERSDTQKLTGKSFEKYDAGVRIKASEELHTDYAARRVVDYELFYKDEQRTLTPAFDLVQVAFPVFQAWSVGGAVAGSALSQARNATPADAPGEVALRQENFAVVFRRNLKLVEAAALHASEAEAAAHVRQLLSGRPSLAGEIQVVPTFEVNRT